jgi:hypothetical protein
MTSTAGKITYQGIGQTIWNHPLCDPGPDIVPEGEARELIVAVQLYGHIEMFSAQFVNDNERLVKGWYCEGAYGMLEPLVDPADDEVVLLGWTTFPEWDHPEWFDTSPQGREDG